MTEKNISSLEDQQELAVAAQLLLTELEVDPDLYEEVRDYLEAKITRAKAANKSPDLERFLKKLKREAKDSHVSASDLARELYSAIILEDEEAFQVSQASIRTNMRQKLNAITDLELPKVDQEGARQKVLEINRHLSNILKALERVENRPLKQTMLTMIDKNIRLEESGVFDEEMTSFLNRAGLMENPELFYQLLGLIRAERLGYKTLLTPEAIRGNFHRLQEGDSIFLFDGTELRVTRNNPLQHKIYTNKQKILSYGHTPGGRDFDPKKYEQELDQIAELRMKNSEAREQAA